MVVEALLALKERNGSSLPALKKHITGAHPDLAFAPHRLRQALKLGIENGTLVKVRPRVCCLGSPSVTLATILAPRGEIETAKSINFCYKTSYNSTWWAERGD